MKAIKFYLPTIERESFERFVSKMKKQVKGVEVSFGEDYSIKSYEDSLKPQLPIPSVGTAIKIEGEVIESSTQETMYGMVTSYIIKTVKGYEVHKKGVLPITEVNDKLLVSCYSTVRYSNERKIVMDRACKAPKKGMEVFEL